MRRVTMARTQHPLPAGGERRDSAEPAAPPSAAPLDPSRVLRLGHRPPAPPASPPPVQRQGDPPGEQGRVRFDPDDRRRLYAWGGLMGANMAAGGLLRHAGAPQGYQRGLFGAAMHLGALRRAPRPIQLATAASTLALGAAGYATGGTRVLRDKVPDAYRHLRERYDER